MPGFFDKITRLLNPSAPKAEASSITIDPLDVVRVLFVAHGETAAIQDGMINVNNGRLWVAARILNLNQSSKSTTIQLDVMASPSPQCRICESFAGIGKDERAATGEVLANFATASFHVIAAALLGHECDQVEVEEWIIDGTSRRVTLGPAFTRGKIPGDYFAWFDEFKKQLQASPLPSGIHWIRLFYAQHGIPPATTEVLLDNEPWPSMQAAIAALPWPVINEYYSTRLFLIIQDIPAAM